MKEVLGQPPSGSRSGIVGFCFISYNFVLFLFAMISGILVRFDKMGRA
jgi:hypothetical protein